MSEAEVSGQAEQDVEPDGEDAEDHQTLHQVGIARVELRHRRAFWEGVEDEGSREGEDGHNDKQAKVAFC